MVLDVRSVSKSYDDQPVLEKISFSLKDGSIVGLLGLNGAGKTTLLKGLASILPFETGTVECNGINLQQDPYRYKAEVGFQPEVPCLQPALTVREQLSFFGSLRGVSELDRRIDELLELLTLRHLQHSSCAELSKGESQRVSFCLATIHKPKLLLLDEPTSGLDPQQLALFRGALQHERSSRAVLLSTHHLHEAESLCDEIFVLHDGTIERIEQASERSAVRLERYFIRSVSSQKEVVHG